MTYARKTLVSLRSTPYYHVFSRCVRQAWLWGIDKQTGRDYSHRKNWVLERLKQQSGMFAIDVCAFAVMSNHYHLALHVARQRAKAWTEAEVVARWTMLFSMPALIERWCKGQLDAAEAQVAQSTIEKWRARLYDISWYMRCLNQHLAKRANAEDGCTGRFWQGRFRSQALLDEAGLLTAMAYIDLNPMRAGIEGAPEDSKFTSIYQRILELRGYPKPEADSHVPLLEFQSTDMGMSAPGAFLPCTLEDYRDLLTWTAHSTDPPQQTPPRSPPPILKQFRIDSAAWELAMRPHGTVFGRAMGRLDALRLHAKTLGQSWIRGVHQAERLYCG